MTTVSTIGERTSEAEAVGCQRPRAGVRVPLDTINSPGTYLCNWSGHLLRVPPATIDADGCNRLNIVGSEPLTVTKLSDDHDLPLSKARGLAWCFGLPIAF